LNDQIEIL